MAFASRGGKFHDNDADGLREPETHDRFGRNNPLRRRNDNDQDSDGWTPVKPRKSFGAEGAERFAGRMGNFRDNKQPPREKDEREPARDRGLRHFDGVTRDRAVEEEVRPRNGLARNKSEAWAGKPEASEAQAPNHEKRERIDRAKSWRDRDPAADDDRRNKNKDRRWGRDEHYRAEQEPEWVDEPSEPKQEKRTQQDFQKWMEDMKRAKNSAAAAEQSASSSAAPAEASLLGKKPTVQSAPAVESGPDKFFLAFGGSTGLESGSPAGEQPGQAAKPKVAGKSSRFTSFFNAGAAASPAIEEQPHPRAEAPPANSLAAFSLGALAAALPQQAGPVSAGGPGHNSAAPDDEKQAFQQLIMKLQKQSATATPPGLSPFPVPSNQQQPAQQQKSLRPSHGESQKTPMISPEPYQQYGMGNRREGPMAPPPQNNIQEILSPRPQQQAARPDQLLQDLVGHHRRVSSQTSQRAEPNNNASRNNSNTEFLMNLMRAGPGSQGPDQHMLRMNQAQKQSPAPQIHEREAEYVRDSRASQRSGRPQQPPGFGNDEQFHHPETEQRPMHPTQILQRSGPPPGLDQMGQNWMPGAGQMPGGQMPPPPPQQRGGPMMPPPGLPGGPARNLPMQHMFPPNFPPGGMPPPEALGGMPPPRNMPPPPPPGFFNGLPPGYMHPGMDGGFNGPPPGMDSHSFIGSPFEGGRGLPPPGQGNRSAFGRQ